MEPPLVTAVMVTGKSPGRQPLRDAAINSFLRQMWPAKELLVVSDVPVEIPEHPLIRVFYPPPRPERYSLGELRNFGIEQAHGDYIIQFDDDDWYHPLRIAYMMAQRRGDAAVLLLWQIRYSFLSNSAFVLRYDRDHEGIPGTVLHPRKIAKYQSIGKHEDSRFLNDCFGQNRVIVNNSVEEFPGPSLYIRFFHGLNTWDERHVMRNYAGPSNAGRWDLPEVHRDYLKAVLEKHYLPLLKSG